MSIKFGQGAENSKTLIKNRNLLETREVDSATKQIIHQATHENMVNPCWKYAPACV